MLRHAGLGGNSYTFPSLTFGPDKEVRLPKATPHGPSPLPFGERRGVITSILAAADQHADEKADHGRGTDGLPRIVVHVFVGDLRRHFSAVDRLVLQIR